MALVVGLMGLAGCREARPEREHRTISGTVTSIDEATGTVSMSFYNKKKQMEMRVEGMVTPQTEIIINGQVSKLSDVKIGEQVTVTGYVEKDRSRAKIVATRVQIERDEWASTSQPSTSTSGPSPAASSKPGVP